MEIETLFCQLDDFCQAFAQIFESYFLPNKIVKEEMGIRSKLLEHVAKRILNRIFDEIAIANEATVEVSKINPPIGGNVQMVTIEMTSTRS